MQKSVVSSPVRIKFGRSTPLKQVVNLQRFAYDVALAIQADVTGSTDKTERARAATALASLLKGWVSLEDTRRVLRGRPLPGSLRPTNADEKPLQRIVPARVTWSPPAKLVVRPSNPSPTPPNNGNPAA